MAYVFQRPAKDGKVRFTAMYKAENGSTAASARTTTRIGRNRSRMNRAARTPATGRDEPGREGDHHGRGVHAEVPP